ncbi:MAG: DUF465 domain-containing protein [Acidobacteria bacterium]|nr:DUF465 domain-containing protein [Acidobacteriota bacterium]
MGDVEIKDYLLSTDDEFRKLVEQHHSYDEQLDKLTHQPFLSDEEKLLETVLKKKKLALKDQMQARIIRAQATVRGR